jgi:23S rRNA pseudouridine2605 synthase
MKIILQKYIARSGYCSRRKAEELIRMGKVKVNGKIAQPGIMAGSTDAVEIGNKKIIPAAEKILIALNKPRGYTSTSRSFKSEKNIFSLLKEGDRLPLSRIKKLKIAGRLDKDSRGLLILTNDGDLVNKLTHPRYEHEKEYLAQIDANFKKIDANYIVRALKKEIDIGGGDGFVRAKKAEYLGNNIFKIILTEGKKRQIRRMFRALRLEVIDLQRVRIGEFRLGGLKEGEWRMLGY